MDTKRRRHQRLLSDYSAHGFRRVFRATKVNTPHHIRPNTHPPLSMPLPFSLPPFPPSTPHHTHTPHATPHTTHITGTRVDTKRRRHRRLFCDYSALRFAVHFGSPNVHTSQHISPTPTHHCQHGPTTHPHHTCNMRHTAHHTHHRYLGGHQATKAPTTISRLFGP